MTTSGVKIWRPLKMSLYREGRLKRVDVLSARSGEIQKRAHAHEGQPARALAREHDADEL